LQVEQTVPLVFASTNNKALIFCIKGEIRFPLVEKSQNSLTEGKSWYENSIVHGNDTIRKWMEFNEFAGNRNSDASTCHPRPLHGENHAG